MLDQTKVLFGLLFGLFILAILPSAHADSNYPWKFIIDEDAVVIEQTDKQALLPVLTMTFPVSFESGPDDGTVYLYVKVTDSNDIYRQVIVIADMNKIDDNKRLVPVVQKITSSGDVKIDASLLSPDLTFGYSNYTNTHVAQVEVNNLETSIEDLGDKIVLTINSEGAIDRKDVLEFVLSEDMLEHFKNIVFVNSMGVIVHQQSPASSTIHFDSNFDFGYDNFTIEFHKKVSSEIISSDIIPDAYAATDPSDTMLHPINIRVNALDSSTCFNVNCIETDWSYFYLTVTLTGIIGTITFIIFQKKFRDWKCSELSSEDKLIEIQEKQRSFYRHTTSIGTQYYNGEPTENE